jgi:hypothetical protein
MLPILQREIVDKRAWATDEDLMDYYAIGQCTPASLPSIPPRSSAIMSKASGAASPPRSHRFAFARHHHGHRGFL